MLIAIACPVVRSEDNAIDQEGIGTDPVDDRQHRDAGDATSNTLPSKTVQVAGQRLALRSRSRTSGCDRSRRRAPTRARRHAVVRILIHAPAEVRLSSSQTKIETTRRSKRSPRSDGAQRIRRLSSRGRRGSRCDASVSRSRAIFAISSSAVAISRLRSLRCPGLERGQDRGRVVFARADHERKTESVRR